MLAGLCAPTAAHAVSIDVTCAGTETVSYSPGLLLTTQTVRTSVTGSLAACSSSDPGITAGTYREDFSASLSCATLLSGRAGTRIFRWSDGTTSTFAFNRALNNAAGQVTVTFSGSITAGRFTGDTVLEQVVFVTPNPLQCLASPGLTTLGPGPVVLSISQL
ncbi:MAG: hypothetical protein HOV87_06850 [Catenulispora sp.]|nr:hypothetical protein [Catenulispora sp.]